MRHSAAIPSQIDAELQSHLLRKDGQEDLCFALWHPSKGLARTSALLSEIILPLPGERHVHGNASFEPHYAQRALGLANRKGAGLAFLHSHLGPGWQGMSQDDVVAEQGLAPTSQGATSLPLVGLTLGTDGAWSARIWEKQARRHYERLWCESVRVIGDAFRMTFNDRLLPPAKVGDELIRTVSAWGKVKQSELNRLHIGIVGAGSVGCIIAEALARMGVARITLIDFDGIELLNLDRLLHATKQHVGQAKVQMLAESIKRSATAHEFSVNPIECSIVEKDGFLSALDCDVLFSCVDRPWARFALNLIAYAHLIPVIDGGIAIAAKRSGGMRNCTIRAHVAAPHRRCLECLGQYKSELVSVERDGLLEDPVYIQGLPDDHMLKRRENVFAFSNMAASMELMQFLSMVIAPSGVTNTGSHLYQFVLAKLDKEESPLCNPRCFFSEVLALGDHAPISAIGRHELAEKARAGRVKVNKPNRVWLPNWLRYLTSMLRRKQVG
jgi:hypothetical protein